MKKILSCFLCLLVFSVSVLPVFAVEDSAAVVKPKMVTLSDGSHIKFYHSSDVPYSQIRDLIVPHLGVAYSSTYGDVFPRKVGQSVVHTMYSTNIVAKYTDYSNGFINLVPANNSAYPFSSIGAKYNPSDDSTFLSQFEIFEPFIHFDNGKYYIYFYYRAPNVISGEINLGYVNSDRFLDAGYISESEAAKLSDYASLPDWEDSAVVGSSDFSVFFYRPLHSDNFFDVTSESMGGRNPSVRLRWSNLIDTDIDSKACSFVVSEVDESKKIIGGSAISAFSSPILKAGSIVYSDIPLPTSINLDYGKRYKMSVSVAGEEKAVTYFRVKSFNMSIDSGSPDNDYIENVSRGFLVSLVSPPPTSGKDFVMVKPDTVGNSQLTAPLDFRINVKNDSSEKALRLLEIHVYKVDSSLTVLKEMYSDSFYTPMLEAGSSSIMSIPFRNPVSFVVGEKYQVVIRNTDGVLSSSNFTVFGNSNTTDGSNDVVIETPGLPDQYVPPSEVNPDYTFPDTSNPPTTSDNLLGWITNFFKNLASVTDVLLGGFQQFTTSFSGFTAFLGSFFSWLPSEIVAICLSGVSLVVVLAVIKFIRG